MYREKIYLVAIISVSYREFSISRKEMLRAFWSIVFFCARPLISGFLAPRCWPNCLSTYNRCSVTFIRFNCIPGFRHYAKLSTTWCNRLLYFFFSDKKKSEVIRQLRFDIPQSANRSTNFSTHCSVIICTFQVLIAAEVGTGLESWLAVLSLMTVMHTSRRGLWRKVLFPRETFLLPTVLSSQINQPSLRQIDVPSGPTRTQDLKRNYNKTQFCTESYS